MKVFVLFVCILGLKAATGFSLGKLLSQAEKGVDAAFKEIKQKSAKKLDHLKETVGGNFGYAEHERDSYLEEVVAKQAKDLAEELDLEEVVEEVNEVLQEPWAEDIEEYGYDFGLRTMLRTVKTKLKGVIKKATQTVHNVFNKVKSSLKTIGSMFTRRMVGRDAWYESAEGEYHGFPKGEAEDYDYDKIVAEMRAENESKDYDEVYYSESDNELHSEEESEGEDDHKDKAKDVDVTGNDEDADVDADESDEMPDESEEESESQDDEDEEEVAEEPTESVTEETNFDNPQPIGQSRPWLFAH